MNPLILLEFSEITEIPVVEQPASGLVTCFPYISLFFLSFSLKSNFLVDPTEKVKDYSDFSLLS